MIFIDVSFYFLFIITAARSCVDFLLSLPSIDLRLSFSSLSITDLRLSFDSTIDTCLIIKFSGMGLRLKMKPQQQQRITNPKTAESPIAAPTPWLIGSVVLI